MTDPFAPKGDVAEWRLVYDKARTLDVGQTLTYEALDELLGRDFRADRGPVYRAMKELEKTDSRTLAAVRNQGYRIAEPREHEGLAVGHHRRSRKQLGKAVSKAASADRSKLTPEERKRIDGLEMTLRQHSDMIRRLAARDQQRAAEIRELRRDAKVDVAEISERVDKLTALLERHGVSPETV